jgi:signal transduction histidine kinase/FixJ family two-component response regulator/HPt (histidine-containing phosphotransfer) domain-containing protein
MSSRPRKTLAIVIRNQVTLLEMSAFLAVMLLAGVLLLEFELFGGVAGGTNYAKTIDFTEALTFMGLLSVGLLYMAARHIRQLKREVDQRMAVERQAEAQFRQAQKMEAVGQLTGGIAHDFNNMLTVITGTIDVLADGIAGNTELVPIIKMIGEAADRGAELVSRLLIFARKQPLQTKKSDINVLIRDSEKLLRSTLGEKIEIEHQLRDSVSAALIDPTQFTTAILNLGANARDAMPKGGKLTLQTANVFLDRNFTPIEKSAISNDYVMISVSDTGAGMSKTVQERIFEPFYSTKEVGKGTGLGLSMVYSFVKQSNGHIEVQSEEGHGSTFNIYLPRTDMRADFITAKSPDSKSTPGNETILVVEDDSLVRSYVIATLKSLGYKTLVATNGLEALAIADSGAQFDLLFTDMIMPGNLDGRELATEMAKRREPLNVLFTSGYTEDEAIQRGQLDSGARFLKKPYRKLELARVIRTFFETPEFPSNHPETSNRAAVVNLPLAIISRNDGATTVTDEAPMCETDPAPGWEKFDYPAFDRSTYNNLVADIGEEKASMILRGFLHETEGLLQLFTRLSCAPDRQQIEREAHTLKSSAAIFGLNNLSALARSMEINAPTMNDKEFLASVQFMTTAYQTARTHLSSSLATG